MVALKVVPFPEHLPRVGIETGRAGRAPCQVNPVTLDDRRRRCVGVEFVRVLRFLDVEQLFFKNNLTAPVIDGERGQPVAFLVGGRQPNGVAGDDRG